MCEPALLPVDRLGCCPSAGRAFSEHPRSTLPFLCWFGILSFKQTSDDSDIHIPISFPWACLPRRPSLSEVLWQAELFDQVKISNPFGLKPLTSSNVKLTKESLSNTREMKGNTVPPKHLHYRDSGSIDNFPLGWQLCLWCATGNGFWQESPCSVSSTLPDPFHPLA